MSVRTETFGHETPRVPLVSIVAAVLAFAVGITLGAIVMDRDSAVPSGGSGAAVGSRGWDQGMLDAAAQRAGAYDTVGIRPWDDAMLTAAAQRAGANDTIGIRPWDDAMLTAAAQRNGAFAHGSDHARMDAGALLSWLSESPPVGQQTGGTDDEWIPMRNQEP